MLRAGAEAVVSAWLLSGRGLTTRQLRAMPAAYPTVASDPGSLL